MDSAEFPAAELAFVRAVLDALPDHIYVKDLQGRYLLVNEAGLRERNLAGLADIAGKTAYELVPREVAERMSAEDRAVVESGNPLVNREAKTAFGGDPGEQARWHITTKTPMRDALGRVIGVIGVNRDITERRRTELALRESEQTFVGELPGSRDAAAVVRAVISLAHSFGLQVIAEGVENEAQLAFLAAQGCDQAQGYRFARPMPAPEFARALAAGRATPAAGSRGSRP